MISPSPLGVKVPVRTAIPFQFRAEPVAIREARNLGHAAKAVFTAILDDARRRNWRSRLSNAALAERIGASVPTVKRALAQLESAGLVRRDTIAGGRIRLGIVVTWSGVDQARSTVQTTADQPRTRGGSSVAQGVDHPRSTPQSVPQSGDQIRGDSPLREEDPEQAARFAELGPARYLRMCIEAGRRAGGYTAPTSSGLANAQAAGPPAPARPFGISSERPPAAPAPSADFARVRKTEAPAEAPRVATICKSGPSPSQDDVRREVEQIAGSIFKDARRAAWGPLPGRRRMTPAELQRQLAEVRRKYRRPSNR